MSSPIACQVYRRARSEGNMSTPNIRPRRDGLAHSFSFRSTGVGRERSFKKKYAASVATTRTSQSSLACSSDTSSSILMHATLPEQPMRIRGRLEAAAPLLILWISAFVTVCHYFSSSVVSLPLSSHHEQLLASTDALRPCPNMHGPDMRFGLSWMAITAPT